MPIVDTVGTGVLALVLNAGPVAKFVLIVLLLFSIASWGLIVDKWWQFRRVRRQTLQFLKIFREGRRPSVVHGAARTLRDSPLAQLYSAAYGEVSRGPDALDAALDDVDEGLGPERLEAVNRAMRRTASHEVAQLERYLGFLATTASACPFIGLFGTVWGIMAAFHGIGTQGSASLAVVAPGISEALIATAAGLGAAIPAVIGYNYFVNRVKHWATEMEGFTLDLLNLLSRPAPKVGRAGRDGL
ncbi:MAG: MotA/TolQ/ExbB proton channel family protein [Candidatus Rokubacteria bacterium]|nr:MotA/TolQ/ExbB proton channel family protein [Candidatus Rokubacteria bacterium]MBI4629641.1 MotA/TolQ/ExbB proton channel family protein [Candidatus Rokubacteria bacterium]